MRCQLQPARRELEHRPGALSGGDQRGIAADVIGVASGVHGGVHGVHGVPSLHQLLCVERLEIKNAVSKPWPRRMG